MVIRSDFMENICTGVDIFEQEFSFLKLPSKITINVKNKVRHRQTLP